MIPMTLERIAEVVGGTLYDTDDPSAEVTGTVEFDSRKIGPGGLFLALPGARSDGHDHAAAAIEAGAVAVLAARPVGVPAIVVPALAPTDTNALALEHDVQEGLLVAGAEGQALYGHLGWTDLADVTVFGAVEDHIENPSHSDVS